MDVDAVVQSDVVTVDPETTVSDVVAEMADQEVGSVVVVEDDEPVGIVTDRQIALAIESTSDLEEKEVSEIVTDDLVTGSTEMSVPEVVERLSEAGVRRLPIVDEDGELAGIVTVDDLLVFYSDGLGDVAEVVRSQSPRL